jgi:hypothetical protein
MKTLPTKAFGLAKTRSKGKIDTRQIEGYRQPGTSPLFEYHCNESHTSSDAPVWYRSHQRVTVLKCHNLRDGIEMPSQAERFANGQQLMYQVLFPDSLKWDVFEDELLDFASEFERPKPPSGPPAGLNGYIIMRKTPEGWRYFGETLAASRKCALLIIARRQHVTTSMKLRADLIDCKFKTPARASKG